MRWITCILVALALVACSTAVRAQTEPSEHQVLRGETLHVVIKDLVGPGVETVKDVKVDADGKIDLPLIKKLKVVNLTCAKIEKKITKAYADAKIIQNAQVWVSVVEQQE